MKPTRPLLSIIGKKPIKFQETTQILHTQNQLTISTPAASKSFTLQNYVKVSLENQKLKVSVADPTKKEQMQMWGTTRQLLQNIVTGLEDGFTLSLRIVGVGYRALLEHGKLSLKIGVSHPVLLDIPNGVRVEIPAPQRIILYGDDWGVLTQFAANVRSKRPPEAYNQKGIFVGDETIRKKEGKKR